MKQLNDYKAEWIQGRLVQNVDSWKARITEFSETLNQLQQDQKRLAASVERARKLGFLGSSPVIQDMVRALWRCNRSIQWYEKEIRIDKSYIGA